MIFGLDLYTEFTELVHDHWFWCWRVASLHTPDKVDLWDVASFYPIATSEANDEWPGCLKKIFDTKKHMIRPTNHTCCGLFFRWEVTSARAGWQWFCPQCKRNRLGTVLFSLYIDYLCITHPFQQTKAFIIPWSSHQFKFVLPKEPLWYWLSAFFHLHDAFHSCNKIIRFHIYMFEACLNTTRHIVF